MSVNSKTDTKKIKKTNVRRAGSLERREAKAFYTIIIPFLLLIIGIRGVPFVRGMYLSFTNYNGFNMHDLHFTGLVNYQRVFEDTDAMYSILRTFSLSLIIVPCSIIVSTILSLLLCSKFKGQGIFRTIYYLPSIIPAIAVALIWKGMYAQNGGFFNAIVLALGQQNINWFDYDHVTTALVVMMLWGAGNGVLANIAALKAVPTELYEAATVDGANYLVKTFKISLPLISNMMYMNLVTSIIGAFQIFAQPVLLTGKGNLTSLPLKPIYTFMVHAYQQIFVNARFGYGLALIWVIFIVIMLITKILEYTSKYWVFNGE